MTKLPIISGKEVIKALSKVGFKIKRMTGSHVILIKEEAKRIVVVPVHSKDIPKGTLRKIIKQANLNVEEFTRLL